MKKILVLTLTLSATHLSACDKIETPAKQAHSALDRANAAANLVEKRSLDMADRVESMSKE